ncbi:hypothetical protein LMG16407_02361 [Pandoraea apista]|nr:hypothetical protein LMG16407_02361 [Pandoraea apista]
MDNAIHRRERVAGKETPIIRHVLRREKHDVRLPGIIGNMKYALAHSPRNLFTRILGMQGKRAGTPSQAKRSRMTGIAGIMGLVSRIAMACFAAIGVVVGTATSAAAGTGPAAPTVELAQATGITYPHEGTVAAAPVDSKTAAKRRAEQEAVPMATDFAAHARRAASLDAPLIVLVSLRDCVYCGPIRQRELAPLVRSGKYEVREIGMDSRAPVRDFDGATTTGVDWARAHGVKVSPTVLFLDTSGRPVADPLIGAGLPDFYGAYLDDAIARGRARLHAGSGTTTR